MNRAYVTFKSPIPGGMVDGQRFETGPLTMTAGAALLAHTYGETYYVESLLMHVRGICGCGDIICKTTLDFDIEHGEPVLTARGPTQEVETSLVFLTNAARTRTVVCTGLEDAATVMAEIDAMTPEQF